MFLYPIMYYFGVYFQKTATYLPNNASVQVDFICLEHRCSPELASKNTLCASALWDMGKQMVKISLGQKVSGL